MNRKPSPMSIATIRETISAPTKPTTLPAITRSTVQPNGLPAFSSFSRMRSLASSGVSRRPSRWLRASRGQCLEDRDRPADASTFLVDAADRGEHQEQRGEDHHEAQGHDQGNHTSTFATLVIQTMPTASSTPMATQRIQPMGVVYSGST